MSRHMIARHMVAPHMIAPHMVAPYMVAPRPPDRAAKGGHPALGYHAPRTPPTPRTPHAHSPAHARAKKEAASPLVRTRRGTEEKDEETQEEEKALPKGRMWTSKWACGDTPLMSRRNS